MNAIVFDTVGPVGRQRLEVRPGPSLLRGIADGPSLGAHRRTHGTPMQPAIEELRSLTETAALRGRGGAGFPFATKLAAAASGSGTPTVVVNLSEGEPASSKDAALAMTAPHLVLDGAEATARALGVRAVHLILPGDQPAVADVIHRAVAERRAVDRRTTWRFHTADSRFVAGQARAVIELMSGRENLPVTAWEPEAMRGYKNRPTMLSNAETYAQVGTLLTQGPSRYAGQGSEEAPGTTLLTLRGDSSRPVVMEVPHGTPWSEVLGESIHQPILLGGFHGVWVAPGGLVGRTVCRDDLAANGLTLGAGVVLPLAMDVCPLNRTAEIADYLAGQSAGRCGPCLNGLPALARTVHELALGQPSVARAEQLVGLVTRRGACAHPDGTARLVSSMLFAFPEEHRVHAQGSCSFTAAADPETDTAPYALMAVDQ